MSLVYGQDKRVTDWVAKQLGHAEGCPAYAAIGYADTDDGDLVAGVFFDGVSGTNVFAHIASAAEALPVALLSAVASYVFVQLKARRMTFMVNDDNLRCLRFVSHLGAELEGRFRQGHPGGDTLIYVLWAGTGFHRRLLAAGRVAEAA